MAAAATLALGAPAQAMSLAEAFEAARAHDPQYSSGAFDLQATREGIPIARAGLMPQVSLNYSKSGYSGTRSFPNGLQQEVTTSVDYVAPSTSLSLRMPLFNYDAWNRLDQATAQTKGAEAAFRSRGLELIDRLTSAYLQTLESRTLQSLTEAEVVALHEQTLRAEQRLRRGEGTRTEEATVRASLEVARARAADAAERVNVAAARVARLTGRVPTFVNDTPPDFLPRPSEPDALRDWTARGVMQNPVIEVRQAAVDAARFAVKRNQSGHLPRVDLVANVSKSSNESLSNLNQSSFLRSVGVQVSLPLFNGFGVQASVRQAQFELMRAQEDLRAERENNELEIRRLLQAVDAAALRAEALRKAVAAGEVALMGATRAQEGGLLTQFDVLEARRNLFASRRDLAQAHYDHLTAQMRLMLVAGEPMQVIVQRIDAALTSRLPLAAAEAAQKR